MAPGHRRGPATGMIAPWTIAGWSRWRACWTRTSPTPTWTSGSPCPRSTSRREDDRHDGPRPVAGRARRHRAGGAARRGFRPRTVVGALDGTARTLQRRLGQRPRRRPAGGVRQRRRRRWCPRVPPGHVVAVGHRRTGLGRRLVDTARVGARGVTGCTSTTNQTCCRSTRPAGSPAPQRVCCGSEPQVRSPGEAARVRPHPAENQPAISRCGSGAGPGARPGRNPWRSGHGSWRSEVVGLDLCGAFGGFFPSVLW